MLPLKSKSALRLCLSLFICSALLIGSESFLDQLISLKPEWFGVLLDALSMLIPIGLLHLLLPKKETFQPKLRPSGITAERLAFTLCAGCVISFVRFVIDYLVYRVTSADALPFTIAALNIPFGTTVSFLAILAVIFVPALTEELYLRGYLQTFLSEYMSTRQVLILLTLVSAMLHGSLIEFPGALVFAFGLSWLSFVFGSFWYAVIAHATATIVYLIIQWLLSKFMIYGLLTYLPAICGILALLFLYIALRLAERLTLRQSFRKLHYVQHSDYSFSKFAGNAAALAFLFVFIAKAVIGII